MTPGRRGEEFQVEMAEMRVNSSPHPLREPFDVDLLSSELQPSAGFLEADWMASAPVHS